MTAALATNFGIKVTVTFQAINRYYNGLYELFLSGFTSQEQVSKDILMSFHGSVLPI